MTLNPYPGASVTLDPYPGESPRTPLPELELDEDAKSLAKEGKFSSTFFKRCQSPETASLVALRRARNLQTFPSASASL